MRVALDDAQLERSGAGEVRSELGGDAAERNALLPGGAADAGACAEEEDGLGLCIYFGLMCFG